MKIEGLQSYHDMDSYIISNNKEKYFALAYLQTPLKDGNFTNEDLKNHSLRIFDNERDFNKAFFAYKANMDIPDEDWKAVLERANQAKENLRSSLVKEEEIKRRFAESSANCNSLAEEKGLATANANESENVWE